MCWTTKIVTMHPANRATITRRNIERKVIGWTAAIQLVSLVILPLGICLVQLHVISSRMKARVVLMSLYFVIRRLTLTCVYFIIIELLVYRVTVASRLIKSAQASPCLCDSFCLYLGCFASIISPCVRLILTEQSLQR